MLVGMSLFQEEGNEDGFVLEFYMNCCPQWTSRAGEARHRLSFILRAGIWGKESGKTIPCSDAVDCKDISTLCCELGESDAGKEDRNMPKQMTSAVTCLTACLN